MPGYYRNPILPGFNPDPSICRVGKDYFLVTSSFEFFPGIPIYHSTDLVKWTLIGHAITRRTQVDMRTVESGAGLWAPTIRYNDCDGKFYVTTGCMYRFRIPDVVPARGFYVSTDNIWEAGSWSDPVHFDNIGIDQELFFDDDGKTYLSVGNRIITETIERRGFDTGIYLSEIDLTTGRTLTDPLLLRASTLGIGVAEGPHIYKRDGYYYLSSAEGGTDSGHQQWIFRSKSIYGPYTPGPRNPILFNRNGSALENTGHMDFVEGPDNNWWAVFLAIRPLFDQNDDGKKFNSPLGRETSLAPVEWVDGWPVVNGGKQVELIGQAEGLDLIEEPKEWNADFSASGREADLPLGWYSLRTPMKKCYSLTERPGHLTIYGAAYTLNDDESPSLLLQRQTLLSMDWTTELQFDPQIVGQEAGTCVWLSRDAYASIGISMTAEGRHVVVRYPNKERNGFEVGSVFAHPTRRYALGKRSNFRPFLWWQIESATIPETGPIVLAIKARPFFYSLHFSIATASTSTLTNDLATVSTQLFTNKNGPSFTGTHFGLYAQGFGRKPCLTPAYFSRAGWKAVVK
ncbi:hypothetical protein QFC24_006745 [Naganishia onofrii]|uniref:Uncharacterized protein n=1 Tax=Naganishia onofrii TaxID=1851511 RepID=A0ACC2WXX4_9TREE|nr:hypothetical protein QFC24_006745 [Naganishia onofrii]